MEMYVCNLDWCISYTSVSYLHTSTDTCGKPKSAEWSLREEGEEEIVGMEWHLKRGSSLDLRFLMQSPRGWPRWE